MTIIQNTKITVEAMVDAPMDRVWDHWTNPVHICRWNQASDDWYTPYAKNDLRVNGQFLSRMEAKDGSAGFDFGGEYQAVSPHERIAYSMSDGREVNVLFERMGKATRITETFDAERTNSVDMQKQGWQAILDNFKQYVESRKELKTLSLEIDIQADVDRVYHTMLGKTSYSEWASEFSPGSYFEGSWDKGSKILFLGPTDNGGLQGMTSRIRENIPLKFVSIEHVGFVENGVETTTGEEVEAWAGALENYTFRAKKGATTLSVSLDTPANYKDYFTEAWPRALKKLKEICES